MEDKRRHMRFNVFLEAFIKRLGKRIKVKVKDYSRSGLGIITDESINVGEALELELLIPGDNVPVVICGQIAWNRDADGNMQTNKAGVEISEIHKDSRVRMLNYVFDNVIKDKSG